MGVASSFHRLLTAPIGETRVSIVSFYHQHFIDLVEALIAPFLSLRHVMHHFGQAHYIRISLGFPVVVLLTSVRHV